MLLSIICPTYNSEATLRTLINSVMSQSSTDYELIIVDGASTDGTLSIINEYKNHLHYVSEPDHGIYDAMNKGIQISSGQWLYFIGSDDSLYSDDVIKNLIPHLDDNVDVLMCDIMSSKSGRCQSQYGIKTYFKNTIHHQGMIYNRRIFERHTYDATYRIMADYELALYIWRNKLTCKPVDIILANHSPEGISGLPRLLNYKEEIAVRNLYVSSKPAQWFLATVSYAKYIIKNLFAR